MSKPNNITINIKNSKVKKIEELCLYFSQDYTAVETAKKLGLSRQTINHYYKIFREKLSYNFFHINQTILEELSKQELLLIQHLNIYNQDIFFAKHEKKIIILKYDDSLNSKLDKFIEKSLKIPLTKHKKANCVRVLLNKKSQSFSISFFLQREDDFEDYLQTRLKQFRGINKEQLFFYIKESQVRYNFSSKSINQKISLSFI